LYEPRLYRGDMNRERFRFFRSVHHESDLLTGVPHQRYDPGMEDVVMSELIRLRKILLDYAKLDPRFLSSLDPIDLTEPAPGPTPGLPVAGEIRTMIACGHLTGTGPMAAVAGLFAQHVGERILDAYGEMEVVVENGGDLYLHNLTDLFSVIHAGSSELSDLMGFVLPPGEWGICTSSGTMGHSFSRGRADAVTVVSSSAPLADSWATAIANRVTGENDLEQVLEEVAGIPDIVGCAVIVANRIGIRGDLEVKPLSSQV
jgi:ApbE superfamily uncharacterized protein (UPF0280 family)